jgi:hypothetical protein
LSGSLFFEQAARRKTITIRSKAKGGVKLTTPFEEPLKLEGFDEAGFFAFKK